MLRILTLFMLTLLVGCQNDAPNGATVAEVKTTRIVAFTNVRLWDGTGAPVQAGSTIVVKDGRVDTVSRDGPPPGSRIIDLGGAFVMPGMINTHGHITTNWAAADETDTAQRVRDGLKTYARYGVTTVLSLGGAPDEAFAVRTAQDPADPKFARAFLAGPVVADKTADAARKRAQANAALNVDWLKVRVDDNLGRSEKMPWEAVQAVIEAGNQAGLRVATHLFYLDDAKALLKLGSGMIAHSVRDLDVDAAFIKALDESGVCYVPTLTREVSAFVYATSPAFLDEPFFQRYASAEQLARVSDPGFQKNMAESESAVAYEKALGQAMKNLGVLSAAGARIAMGTDSGPAGRFPGFFEHLELKMMVEAGMSPQQALRSATGLAADCLGMTDIGTLQPGRWADFMVLKGDPTQDILATRSLQRVFLAGKELR